MRLSIGASHCEIDAKVLKEVGLEMHLHTHSEGFRDGLVGTFLAAEGMGLAQPLVSLRATIAPFIFVFTRSQNDFVFFFTRPISPLNEILTECSIQPGSWIPSTPPTGSYVATW